MPKGVYDRKKKVPSPQSLVPRDAVLSQPLAALGEIAPTRITVVWKRGLGAAAREEREVLWPSGWRLPAAGDAVHLAEGEGGWVEYVDWDVGAGVMRVMIR